MKRNRENGVFRILLSALLMLALLAQPVPPAMAADTDGRSYYAIVKTTMEKKLKASDGNTYQVTVNCTGEARVPRGAELSVREIEENTEEYETCLALTNDALPAEERVAFARFFDISILVSGREFEPKAPVETRISLWQEEAPAQDSVAVVHVQEEAAEVIPQDTVEVTALPEDPEDTQVVPEYGTEGQEIVFTAESFSIYGVVVKQSVETTVVTADGESYRITVTYGEDAQIPAGVVLDAEELLPGTSEYDRFLRGAAEALGAEASEVSYAKLLDISLRSGSEKVQPKAKVDVQIELLDREAPEEETAKVVHFGGTTEILASAGAKTEEGCELSFKTDSFSVYAVVEAPEHAAGYGWVKVSSVEEIAALGSRGLYMAHADGYFFTDGITKISGSRTGITKTAKTNSPESAVGAVPYYFVPADGSADRFLIYCGDEDRRRYVKQSANSLSLTDEAGATVFTVSAFPNREQTFRMLGTDGYYWNMQGGDKGASFAAYNSATDTNARICLYYYESADDDPYGLDGRSFGIAWHSEDIKAAAMTAQAKKAGSASRLAGISLLVRPEVLKRDGNLLVSKGSDIPEWTFHSVKEDRYTLSAEIGGQTRYLTIRGTSVTLEEEPDPACSVLRAEPGSGAYQGKYRLAAGGYALTLEGASADNGFGGSANGGANSWLNLVERSSVLTDEDFIAYTAHKVSVSDPEAVPNGAQVVLYTRIWNEHTLRYEFYAVDHDGTLIRVYESGDVIQWIGSRVNTALWDFTEYYYKGTAEPNYYYELYNPYSRRYIAPQIGGGQILSAEPIGVNLNGRRYGDDYTTVIAWDDPYYDYAGLKTKDGRVAACPLAQAGDFYFAVAEPAEDELTSVATVDHTEYGITMRMVDFNNPIREERDSGQTAVLGRDSNAAGLLSTDLQQDGWPLTESAVTGKPQTSLRSLFSGMQEVNHLFIESTYHESGYFEYDSTQNFAHLNADGRFTVYDQLGAIGTQTRGTRTHGQFMPYNALTPGLLSRVTNQTNVLAQPLADVDPRKGESMYLIPQDQADYFFGMEMEAGFTQTADGLDAWGHDIIFEFSGDDDFWLYVDGELVLDLGGVHSAMTGSINFRTGQVTTSNRGNTTLREQFAANYRKRHAQASAAEVDAWLDGIFTQNADGQYVFRDYSSHSMKMFYMERGAGASNLHMRFNLAAVKPGTVVLSKTISGTDRPDYTLAEFPYQIWYQTQTDGESAWHLLEEADGEDARVTYAGRRTPVKYAESFTPAGGITSYENVFFLKPGQSAEIRMPEKTTRYYIAECGVNAHIYDRVQANGRGLSGMDADGDGRAEFATEAASVEERPTIDFDNHVNADALRTLTITKRLFAEDGVTPIGRAEDGTGFTFRLYLGSENDAAPAPANMQSYHVRDEEGHYCRWDAEAGGFASLGKTQFGELTASERAAATFATSINGSISKIPVDYSVEVRELLVGTQFMVEERENEIPAGYTLQAYRRVEGSFIAGEQDNTGEIRDNSDPAIEVHNRRGWGLTARKIWADADYMESHAPVYLAVFANGTPLPGSVRQLAAGETSVRWYFDSLISGASFGDYTVREVTLNGTPHAETDGTVRDPGEITPVEEGGITEVSAVQQGEQTEQIFPYTVTYRTGETGGAAGNVRTDTVTNTRAGVRLQKTDWSGAPLAGASFLLTDTAGNDVGAGIYTSDEEGLITVAYLRDGEYTLAETAAPAGYQGLRGAVTIRRDGQDVTVSGPDEEAYVCDTTGEMPVITLRDRTFRLEAVLLDGQTEEPLAEGRFSLYRRVSGSDRALMRDYRPIETYEEMISNEEGMIASGLEILEPGLYALSEPQAPEGYQPVDADVHFAVSETGEVTLEPGDARSIESRTGEDGVVTYRILIRNVPAARKISFRKVDTAAPETSFLEGAAFDLYRTAETGREETPLLSGLVSGTDGLLALDGETVFELGIGRYELVETAAPEGYNRKEEPVTIFVNSTGVTYDEGSGLSVGGDGQRTDPETGIVTLRITNSAGVELPRTGGMGTAPVRMAGALLAAAAFILLALRRRKA